MADFTLPPDFDICSIPDACYNHNTGPVTNNQNPNTMNTEDMKPTAADVRTFVIVFLAVCAGIFAMQRMG